MIYITYYIYIYVFFLIYKERHRKYRNKRLENNFKPMNIAINDMDKFENKKEITKKRTFTKNSRYDLYDWLINYIPAGA